MDLRDEKQFGEFFGKAFREVVLPVLEDMNEHMATKQDINELRQDIERIDRKLDKHQDRMDRHAKDIEKQDKRLNKFESKMAD